MEGFQNFCQISQNDVRKIDASQVSYYTLKDGTIVHIKREDEATNYHLQNDQQFIADNYSNSKQNQQMESPLVNQYQEQAQFGSENQYQEQQILNSQENENNLQMNSNLVSGNQTQIENEQVILQPGDNYGFYVSGQGRSRFKKNRKQLKCTCNQIPLIDGEILGNQINQFGINNYSHYGTQTFHQGRRQLYKLITAVPVKLNDLKGVKLMNQKDNTQIHLRQYNSNTYMVGKTKHQKAIRQMRMNVPVQDQLYQNNYESMTFNRKANHHKHLYSDNINQSTHYRRKYKSLCPSCDIQLKKEKQRSNSQYAKYKTINNYNNYYSSYGYKK